MEPLTTRKGITLPSGGTCTVRALSAFDFASMKRKPQAFPTGEDLEKVKSGEREMTDTEVETNAAFMETILLRCVSPITWGDNRRRVVEDGDLDQVVRPRTFLKDTNFQVSLHRLAKTYGKLPSEILQRGMDCLQIDMMVCNAGVTRDNYEQERAMKRRRK